MKRRKVCVVITARPSYSRIKTALRAIQEHPDLELQLVVAASALLDRYGSAINAIERDGFEIRQRVYMVLEGAGWSVIEGQRFDWEQGDIFAIPAWSCHEHANHSQTEVAALFAFTDAPVMQALGLYREEVYTAHGGHQPVL